MTKASSTPVKSGSASSTTHPRSRNVWRFALTTRVISGSNGMPPTSLNQATRVPLKLRASGARNIAPSSSRPSGSGA